MFLKREVFVGIALLIILVVGFNWCNKNYFTKILEINIELTEDGSQKFKLFTEDFSLKNELLMVTLNPKQQSTRTTIVYELRKDIPFQFLQNEMIAEFYYLGDKNSIYIKIYDDLYSNHWKPIAKELRAELEKHYPLKSIKFCYFVEFDEIPVISDCKL